MELWNEILMHFGINIIKADDCIIYTKQMLDFIKANYSSKWHLFAMLNGRLFESCGIGYVFYHTELLGIGDDEHDRLMELIWVFQASC